MNQSQETQPSSMMTPKLWATFKEGYGIGDFRADLIAGLTVAIVALPLSMAIAIASGVTPDMGLYTAIVGGFLVSAFSGSRHQIGGPAGAFIVLVAATVSLHGVDGLILATAMSGIMMVLAGWLRLGTYIKFIPYPVTIGFTAGIAVIIFSSQIKDLFGLTLSGKEPGEIIDRIETLAAAAGTYNPSAIGTAVLTIALIFAVKKFKPHWPNLLVAVGAASLVVYFFALPTETIGTKFGGIPRTLPLPHLPNMSPQLMMAVLPDAISFALLGAIESLLSAVVADGMTGRRHRSNMELIAQGIANVGAAIFGGFCVTGTIARTATNVRAGAKSPVSGMIHAVFILLFMLVAAPLASYIPLAALAGVLASVAWNMVERPAFAALMRSSWGDRVVLMATFLLVVFRDLTEGIVVGFSLGAFLFIEKMSRNVQVKQAGRKAVDEADLNPFPSDDPDTVAYRINGVFFFGAASTVGAVLDRIADQRKNFILDCTEVPFLDSSAANVIEGSVRKARRQGVRFMISGATKETRRMLETHHVSEPEVQFFDTIEGAFAAAKAYAAAA